jgi:hypothetical protein
VQHRRRHQRDGVGSRCSFELLVQHELSPPAGEGPVRNSDRRRSDRGRGKSDPIDALNLACAAVQGFGCPGAVASDEHGGLGRFIVERLTRRWGMMRENRRTDVWFELTTNAPAYTNRPRCKNIDATWPGIARRY